MARAMFGEFKELALYQSFNQAFLPGRTQPLEQLDDATAQDRCADRGVSLKFAKGASAKQS